MEAQEQPEKPWWERNPAARLLIARGARPPQREPQHVPILPPLEPIEEGPGLSELLLRDRRQSR